MVREVGAPSSASETSAGSAPAWCEPHVSEVMAALLRGTTWILLSAPPGEGAEEVIEACRQRLVTCRPAGGKRSEFDEFTDRLFGGSDGAGRRIVPYHQVRDNELPMVVMNSLADQVLKISPL